MGETYKAIEVTRPGEFAAVLKPLVDPGTGQVRLRVEACGVCHSDSGTIDGKHSVNGPITRRSPLLKVAEQS